MAPSGPDGAGRGYGGDFREVNCFGRRLAPSVRDHREKFGRSAAGRRGPCPSRAAAKIGAGGPGLPKGRAVSGWSVEDLDGTAPVGARGRRDPGPASALRGYGMDRSRSGCPLASDPRDVGLGSARGLRRSTAVRRRAAVAASHGQRRGDGRGPIFSQHCFRNGRFPFPIRGLTRTSRRSFYRADIEFSIGGIN